MHVNILGASGDLAPLGRSGRPYLASGRGHSDDCPFADFSTRCPAFLLVSPFERFAPYPYGGTPSRTTHARSWLSMVATPGACARSLLAILCSTLGRLREPDLRLSRDPDFVHRLLQLWVGREGAGLVERVEVVDNGYIVGVVRSLVHRLIRDPGRALESCCLVVALLPAREVFDVVPDEHPCHVGSFAAPIWSASVTPLGGRSQYSIWVRLF